MTYDTRKRGVAPKEQGELPNERRCRQCLQLLTVFEASESDRYWWCRSCGIPYGAFKGGESA